MQVWNGIQGDIYKFQPCPTEKCLEATKSIELSAFWIKTASSVKVKNHANFCQIADMRRFTIYERGWEKYYAVRIEVWQRNASTGEETKLMENTYRVEGRMR